jgi:DNA-binding CsgD family transcriptional regulator
MDRWPLIGRADELLALDRALGRSNLVFVLGDVGCGKSRLVQEYVQGREHTEVIATAAASTIALGAFAPILPLELPGDPFERLQSAAGWLRDNVSLLVVDDAHLLDPSSAAVVQQVASVGGARVVGTVRTGEVTDPSVQALWADGEIERLRLGPLGREATASLLRTVLDGPLTLRTEHELWHRSGGNPLALRELVSVASETGVLVRRDGTWRLDAPLEVPRDLVDVVEARVGGLVEGEREALELVAVGDPLPLGVASALGIIDVCERLESRGLIQVGGRDGNGWVRPSHPLQGEAIRAALPALRRRRHVASLAAVAVGSADVDLVRAATWQLDAGEAGDPALLRRASAMVRAVDPAHGLRLARAAVRVDPSLAGWCELAQAASYAGADDMVTEALDQAEAAANTPSEVVEVAVTATRWVGLSPDAQEAATRRAVRLRDRVSAPEELDRIDTGLGLLAAVTGDLDQGRSASDRVLVRADASGATRLTASAIRASLEVLAGCDPDANGVLRDAETLAEELDDHFSRMHLVATRMTWHALQGRIFDALNHGAQALSGASELGSEAAVRAYATWQGMTLELAGALDVAAAELTGAEHRAEQADPFVLQVFLPVIHAVVDGQRGDLVGLRRQLVKLPRGADRDIRVQAWRARAQVWERSLEGDVDGAAQEARRAGDGLRGRGWCTWAGRAYYDAVRIGRPQVVSDALHTLLDEVDGSAVLFRLMAEHATAAAEGDPDHLDTVAGAWASAGGYLSAAEAAGLASTRHALAGRPDLAARSAVRAESWLSRCPGAATPGLVGWRSPLTDREREVAWLAADGLTSREVAERLVVSVRTVDNHLASVYRKVGIAGREQLAAALGISAPDGVGPEADPTAPQPA